MVDFSIDKLIFVFSTTYFTSKLVDIPLYKRDSIIKICLEFSKSIVNGKDDYYLYADFSKERVLNTETEFFLKIESSFQIKERAIFDLCLKSLRLKHEYVLSKMEIINICELIELLIEELYLYLSIEVDVKNEIFDIDSIEQIISKKYTDVSEDYWLNSDVNSDIYIAKIMGDTPESVYYYYIDMISIPIFKLYPFTIFTKNFEENINIFNLLCSSLDGNKYGKGQELLRKILFGNNISETMLEI
ncbi:hypothetical protein [Ornithobacterium rhinotracheale]|uniref:Uncharacterized protein n=1 Tax=Ornithobacterium rhinotracheale (strain ATCC 51463 / DSM 15997 / CCUG 23171 / CIP 104009 / LMG 9086) TaxID=867902 RepID=I3ZXY8_ORNRL|nr:hypothetical protein [Ornithobacterium rhinotracheale]AFL96572.1 hypothetical protein Ornrh_0364 [Ornithobacterium rhinotracheale DSM 15997]AIQ00310.1 hypothetical protein Q785_01950 [Ornithobacterium rhinotracheale ORT-UMN 88]MCK0203936.1 hypothetical protein [Ornithobacterium rhinotracheale]UOH62862.1 hypothetical protein MT993_07515 [Ornithobacterium rhinotracheale]UOH64931.1 hypothetical protein MT999_06895 [Ornithobacterium rhinotracheale]